MVDLLQGVSIVALTIAVILQNQALRALAQAIKHHVEATR